MSDLEIQLLGNFSVTYNGVPLTTLRTSRLQAFLAYLLLNRGTTQSRNRVAFQFWPDSSESQARTNLRNLVHLLRKAIPNSDCFIRSDSASLEWRKDAHYKLDVAEFEGLLASQPGKRITQEAFERVVQIYRGDLLPSCYDDWIIPERERLRLMFLSALEALAVMNEEAREYAIALGYARSLAHADPLQPGANRLLIRLYALLGDRPAAMKAYQSYCERLQNELGAEPDPEIQTLARQIEQIYPSILRTIQSDVIPLVGRQAEWRRIQTIWQSASSGNPQILFITGEAGIGKTRLVEEMVQWASRQGIRTAVANCYPAEGSLPYAPVVSWLRSLPLPRLEATWLTELSRLMPEVLRAYPKLVPPTQLSEAWQRLRLFEAMARGILGNHQKLLLVIEDLQWCDQDTLEWLSYLLRFDTRTPLLILGSIRWEEMAHDHPIKGFQTMLAASGKSSQMEIKTLDQAESFQLANQIALQAFRSPLDPGVGAHIYKQTEGNPLFIVETVRLGHPMLSEGSLPIQDALLSEKAQAVLRHRIGQLSSPTRELACLAATIGRQFSLDVLRQASGIGEEELVSCLDELLLRRIIREYATDQYDFSHDKLRETTFAGLSTAHRRLLHRKVAEAYLHLDEGPECRRDAEVANHYELAGLHLQAIHHYRLAAEAAVQIAANADAQHFLQKAIDLSEAQGIGEANGIPAVDFAGLLVRLGELQVLNGQNCEAQVTLERALAQPFSTPGLWRSQIYRKISEAQFQLHKVSLAFSTLDQAEQALNLPVAGSTLEERQEWLQIQLARSQLFYWDNQPDQIDALVQKIRPMIEADGRMDQQSDLLSQQFMARLRHERYRLSQETVAICRQRLALAEKFADPYTLAFAQFQLGFGLLWHGDPHSAREWMTKSFDAVERLGARLLQLRCLTFLNIIDRKLGNLELVRLQTPQLLRQALAMDEHGYYGIALANQGWLAWRDGDEMSAVNLCQSAIKYWNQYASNYTLQSLAVWVLLAITVSQQNQEESKHWTQVLLDPNHILQPVEEPMAGLLSQALSACLKKNFEDAFALFCLAVEQAKDHREL